MPIVTAVLLVTIILPGQQPARLQQPMESVHACLELAEAFLTLPADTPVLRHGARLSAACIVDVASSIDG